MTLIKERAVELINRLSDEKLLYVVNIMEEMEGVNEVYMKKEYHVTDNSNVTFINNMDVSVGTGRMYLALHKEYHDQLEMVQRDIGFSYIRGHGLFCDDMGIYHEYEEEGILKVEYNFTYVDRVFDDYLSMGLKPFVELGFMPKKLASSEKTVFYWKGNVTPPREYSLWSDLVQATIEHWIQRYGREEVRSWLFEVWNEPNLDSFWKDADMQEYFKLYRETSEAVKRVDEQLKVGGPAICGVDDKRWLNKFLEYCEQSRAPIDFVTRHFYCANEPERTGHYVYQSLRDHEVVMAELQDSRDIIDSFPCFKGMDMHITEFNTSYVPNCPVHDNNLNAAYIAKLLGEVGNLCTSYAYWTFGDVFEETGIPFTPFHGGFGLLANGCIPKPTYWTFKFFKNLGEQGILQDEHCVFTRKDKDTFSGVLWNPILSDEEDSDVQMRFEIDCEEGEYVLITKSVTETNGNPLLTWHNIGAPSNPSIEQMDLIRQTALPKIETNRISVKNGTAVIDKKLTKNEVCFVEFTKINVEVDRGFDIGRVLKITP